jgi:hypothetical protein
MNPEEISRAKNPDLPASLIALRRAAAMARQVAIETNTGIVVVEGGRLVCIPAEQLRKGAA